MEKEKAEEIWETFMTHPSMLIQPKGNGLLKPSMRQIRFLGSSDTYKKYFIKAMEGVKL